VHIIANRPVSADTLETDVNEQQYKFVCSILSSFEFVSTGSVYGVITAWLCLLILLRSVFGLHFLVTLFSHCSCPDYFLAICIYS